MIAAEIRRNKDGRQHLGDLRKLLATRDDVCVYREGGRWIISTFVKDGTKSTLGCCNGYWHADPCPFHWTEREAIRSALKLDQWQFDIDKQP